MGGPDGAKHLHDFTLLPGQNAALRFMAQCLEPPQVAGADINDPQTNQIRALLAPLGSEKLRLLDFGAGKGRLLATLASGPTLASDWLHYVAFEPYSRDGAKELLKAVADVYGEGAHRHVHLSQNHLNARVDARSIDVVVMCNVLHELSPAVWLEWFGATGEISRLLKPGGKLLLVEDYGLPVGERAHEYGFLLLDEEELVPLFDIQESDRETGRFARDTPTTPSFRDRLVAFAIDGACVERASAKTIHKAIKTLERRTIRAISRVLSNPAGATSKEGRAYARNAQLHANAQIWLDANHAPA
jgi:SAM-dependent methyltransferase